MKEFNAVMYFSSIPSLLFCPYWNIYKLSTSQSKVIGYIMLEQLDFKASKSNLPELILTLLIAFNLWWTGLKLLVVWYFDWQMIISFHLWSIDICYLLFGILFCHMVYKTQTGGIQAIQCLMDSENTMKMKSEEMFVTLKVNNWLLWIRINSKKY